MKEIEATYIRAVGMRVRLLRTAERLTQAELARIFHRPVVDHRDRVCRS